MCWLKIINLGECVRRNERQKKKRNLNFIGGVINCDIYLNKYFGFE